MEKVAAFPFQILHRLFEAAVCLFKIVLIQQEFFDRGDALHDERDIIEMMAQVFNKSAVVLRHKL